MAPFASAARHLPTGILWIAEQGMGAWLIRGSARVMLRVPRRFASQKRSSEGLNGIAMMLKILLYSLKETPFDQGVVVDVC